jgi:hypothetical protein
MKVYCVNVSTSIKATTLQEAEFYANEALKAFDKSLGKLLECDASEVNECWEVTK